MKATELWSELGSSTDRRFDEYLGAPAAAERARAQQRVLLALELRWKLEEQLLLPAMVENQLVSAEDAAAVGEEIRLLRQLAALVTESELNASASIVVMGTLEGIAALRADTIERSLATGKRLDGQALADEMQALLRRWRGEVAATGDIEDEERDPVGMPPR